VGRRHDGAAVGQSKPTPVAGDVAAQAQAGTDEVVAVLLGVEGDHVGVWGAEIRFSCGEAVFVDQSAEAISALDAV
jgi:hypothetical protein